MDNSITRSKNLKFLWKNYIIMSNQPDLIGLKIGEFQQKNEDAEKLCKKSRDSYLISTEKNHAAQPTQRPNIYRAL